MSMCYACRATIDSLATRCPYCTSQVEAYTGNNPNRDTSGDGFAVAAVAIVVGGVMVCSAVKWLIDVVFRWFS